MKFETLKKNKLKYIMPILLVVLAVFITFVLKISHSKYAYSKNYPLASGTINYTLPDLNVVGIYQQESKGSSSYKKIDSAPTSGFRLNPVKSYCGTYNANGEVDKDSAISLDFADGGDVTVYGLKKGARCIVYFDYEVKGDGTSSGMLAALRTLNPDIPASSGTRSSFSSVIDSGSYTYTAEDDLGTSYYFAGAVNTNWVKLGNNSSGYTYWRIVRINGNGSVRLIYSGTPGTSAATQLDSKSGFNSGYQGNVYVGYMYGSTIATTYADTHTNTYNSDIKVAVDSWYGEKKSAFESYIDPNVGFCGDRSIDPTSSGTGIGTTATNYGARYRLCTNKLPDITCNKSNSTQYNNDLYTKTGASRGNKALANPVGLITADEVALAGGVYGSANTGYYLYTGKDYWTMSPSFYGGSSDYLSKAYMFGVDSDGDLSGGIGHNVRGVRPVINLKSSLTWSGTGEWSSPFTVG